MSIREQAQARLIEAIVESECGLTDREAVGILKDAQIEDDPIPFLEDLACRLLLIKADDRWRPTETGEIRLPKIASLLRNSAQD